MPRCAHSAEASRQQKVKEALYLFLLQKREENELSQAFTAYNTRIITPPMGPVGPTSPVRRNILLIAFVAGLAIPAGILFTMESLNTKVRVRKDIENITAPFLGELPMSGKVRKKGIRARLLSMIGIKPKAGDVERYEILVKEGSRNIVNEAFRVIRSNLEFIIGKNTDHKVITRVRDKNLMIFNQSKDIEYWAAFQGRLIYLYSLVLIPEDKLPV